MTSLAGEAYGRERPPATGPAGSRRDALLWLAGVGAAVAVLGPALRAGSLFALDAAFVPRIPVPSGVWGLGPELPRRVPLGVPLAWASTAVGGDVAGKLLLALALAVAFVGAARLCSRATSPPRTIQLLSGALYALSPLVLTRVGAGQWTALAAFAVLPWALPSLLAPSRSLPRTFLWGAAMAATGSVGGTLALLAVAVGLAAERSSTALAGAGLATVAQLVWAVPMAVVAASGTNPIGAEVFATRADGVAGAVGVLAGHGFWRAPTQVGGDATIGTALLAAGLLALAVMGTGSLPAPWKRRAAVLAGLGWSVAMATAVPGLRVVYAAFSRTPLGAPFRESQRFAVLAIVWLAPAAALGARRLAVSAAGHGRVAGPAMPVALALAAAVLALPGLWGVGGRLRPVDLPEEWADARRAVDRAPGTVLGLPFHRHLDLPVAGDRRVLNPLPDYLGGDVLTSSDLGLGPGYRELADPREGAVKAVLSRAAGGVSEGLADAGVRWVVLLHAADWQDYGWLAAEPGLRAAVAGPSLDLLEVGSWRGPAIDRGGRTVAVRPVIAPFQRLEPTGPAVWSRPAAPGWMRGARPADRTALGLVGLPPGRGPVWFWPALVVVAVDAAAVGATLWAWRSLRRGSMSERRKAPVEGRVRTRGG